MSDVPNDVFREVLMRVPVETLFISRSVCKAWRNIIDEPAFAKQHFNRGLGNDYLIMRSKTGKISLLSMSHIISNPKMCVEKLLATNVTSIVGRGVRCVSLLPVPSCNGLILYSICKENSVWEVWNPFTGEYLNIWQCEFPVVKMGRNSVCSGIGYDEANDDYKFVRIFQPHTFIYSINRKCWSRVDELLDCNLVIRPNATFAYGALHWVVDTMDGKGGWVISLDLTTESYRTLQNPSEVTGISRSPLHLYAIGDDLFLSCVNFQERYVSWILEDYGCENTWVKVISVRIEEKLNGSVLRPLAYLKSKGQFLIHTDYNEFTLYDTENKCSTRVSFNNPDFFSCQVSRASLARLSKSDGSDEGVTSKGALKNKRMKKKRKVTPADRLLLQTTFGSPTDW